MADGIRFVCDSCGFAIEAWSELWIEDKPNDVHYLCRDCGQEVKIDGRLKESICPECKSTKVVGTYWLEGVQCPKCRNGSFGEGEEFYCFT